MTVAEHISSVCRISVMEHFLRAPAAIAVAAAETLRASHSQTAVAAAGTLRRHTLRLLLRQQGRCGVTFARCCCGSRDVEASFWQTTVASAGSCQWWLLRISSCGDRSAALAMKLHRLEEGCQTSPPFFAEAKWFSHMPWWSANPPLFQRGGCLRRVIALHIGVVRITRLRPSASWGG